MSITHRPLSDRTWLRPPAQRVFSQFESTWSATKKLLLREVEHLGGTGLVIELDVREQDFKLDGGLRANAKIAGPAVVVAFDTRRHGPMLYRADRYETRWVSKQGPGWQQNVRAVALTLEALRAADRYGATDTGQQYQGFKAIGGVSAASAMAAPAPMTEQEAERIFGHWSGETVWATDENPRVHRAARAAAHPDRNAGDQTGWDDVERAARFFGLIR